MSICNYATIVGDICICKKFNSYCYLETPDLKLCGELYGHNEESESNSEDYVEDISEDEIDNFALYDEEGVEDLLDDE